MACRVEKEFFFSNDVCMCSWRLYLFSQSSLHTGKCRSLLITK